MGKNKALFIHISKCAGSSICLAPFIILHGSPEWSPRVAVEDIESLKFSFAFVRDPYTRFTSAVLNHGYATPNTFEYWVMNDFLDNHIEKLEFKKRAWQELIPQYKYLLHDSKINKHGIKYSYEDVDFVGYFENLKKDWEKVCMGVGQHFELPHINKNKYSNHNSVLTYQTRAVIREIYKKDFELLGYKK